MVRTCAARGHLPPGFCGPPPLPLFLPFFLLLLLLLSLACAALARASKPGGGSPAKDISVPGMLTRCQLRSLHLEELQLPKRRRTPRPAGQTDPLTARSRRPSSRCLLLALRHQGNSHPRDPGTEMEAVQELIPLAKEMMSQKHKGKLVKLYVLGSVLALFGVVLGLVETVCSPFTAASRLRDEEAVVAELQDARERHALRRETLLEKGKQQEALLGSRAHSHRQHAS